MVISGNVMFVSIPHVLCDIVVMQITVNQWCELHSQWVAVGCNSGQRAFQERGGRMKFHCQLVSRIVAADHCSEQSPSMDQHRAIVPGFEEAEQEQEDGEEVTWIELQHLPFGATVLPKSTNAMRSWWSSPFCCLNLFAVCCWWLWLTFWSLLIVWWQHLLLVDSHGAMLDKNNMSMLERL